MSRTSVIIASQGRSQLLTRSVAYLQSQTVQPFEIIVSCVTSDDVEASRLDKSVVLLFGEKGSSCQRNLGMKHVSSQTELVCFFDDDFVPAIDWIEQAQNIFAQWEDVVCATGLVLEDGIKGPGISFDDALKTVELRANMPHTLETRFSPYGCNMIFRRDAIRRTEFDENLPLYGWQEDRDFGARVGARGRTVKASALRGVHLGIKSGRTSGVRFGYSQVINPVYLVKKETMSLRPALYLIFRNVASNILRSMWQEPYLDRRGRLKGNVLALWQLLKGKADPLKVLEI